MLIPLLKSVIHTCILRCNMYLNVPVLKILLWTVLYCTSIHWYLYLNVLMSNFIFPSSSLFASIPWCPYRSQLDNIYRIGHTIPVYLYTGISWHALDKHDIQRPYCLLLFLTNISNCFCTNKHYGLFILLDDVMRNEF